MQILSSLSIYRSRSARVEMRLQEIFILAQDNLHTQTYAHQSLDNDSDSESSIKDLMRHLRVTNPPLFTNSLDTPAELADVSTAPQATQSSGTIKAFHNNGTVLFESAQMTAVAAIGIRTAQFPRTACAPWCSCVCHRERRIRTPQMLEYFIGALFVNYSGLPVVAPPCNERNCHLRAQPLAQVTYFFPTWLLSRMISFMMTITPLAGPVASLKVSRTVPGSADIFTFAKLGDVRGMRRLFESGLASPHDVDFQSGVTPLHVSLILWH